MISQTDLFNISQLLRQKQGQPPLLCHKETFIPGVILCTGCEPGQIFECDRCLRLNPYCRGAADEFGEMCDECWASLEAHAQQISREAIASVLGEVNNDA